MSLTTLVLFASLRATARPALPFAFLSQHTARALSEGPPPLDRLRSEVLKQKEKIEAHAQDEIVRAANFRELKNFYVDYATLRCVSTPRLNAAEKPTGACVMKAHAYQLTAEIAVTLARGGLNVHALETTVD